MMGVAKVESTTCTAPQLFAIAEMAGTSASIMVGFVGLSLNIIFVLPGCTAAAMAVTSTKSTKVTSTRYFSMNSMRAARFVPPYEQLVTIAWSPVFKNAVIMVQVAAMPVANIAAPAPSPSIFATLAAMTSTVGFLERV